MAKVKLSPMFDEVRGLYGDIVYREVKGITVLAHRPNRNGRELTSAQAAAKERFLQAVDFSKYVMQDAPVRELYEQAAIAKGKSVYALCIADFFSPPVVVSFNANNYNGQVGDTIKFICRDDFGIASVTVTLADDDNGTLIERGEGVPEVAGTGHWMYTVTKPVAAGVTVSIQINAFDRPGGMGMQRGTKRI